MTGRSVVVLDYGSGNLRSAQRALERVGADVEVNLLAHEIAETTTDPLGTGWYDASGLENADKCSWKFGSTSSSSLSKNMRYNVVLGGKYFLLQTNWQNYSSGGCVIKF